MIVDWRDVSVPDATDRIKAAVEKISRAAEAEGFEFDVIEAKGLPVNEVWQGPRFERVELGDLGKLPRNLDACSKTTRMTLAAFERTACRMLVDAGIKPDRKPKSKTATSKPPKSKTPQRERKQRGSVVGDFIERENVEAQMENARFILAICGGRIRVGSAKSRAIVTVEDLACYLACQLHFAKDPASAQGLDNPRDRLEELWRKCTPDTFLRPFQESRVAAIYRVLEEHQLLDIENGSYMYDPRGERKGRCRKFSVDFVEIEAPPNSSDRPRRKVAKKYLPCERNQFSLIVAHIAISMTHAPPNPPPNPPLRQHLRRRHQKVRGGYLCVTRLPARNFPVFWEGFEF